MTCTARFLGLHRLLWLALGLATPPVLAVQTLGYEVLREAPHDPALFTQGLLVQGEALVETSGGYGKSLIRRYHADTDEVLAEKKLPRHIFAEGVAQVGEHLYLLSWKKGISYVLDANSLATLATHTYQGEGWGLTYDGRHLIMSNGSDTLTLRKPTDFSPVAQLPVTGGGRSWRNLNELEFAQGYIWANIWQDTRIIAIDPEYGTVAGVLDLAELVRRNSERPSHSVLNGIAYDERQQAFWITGKLWPRRYLVKITWPNALGNDAE